MISHPKPGQCVRVHYNAGLAPRMPHHGKLGTVLFKAGGRRCRNHAILIDDGPSVVIPAGNLVPADAERSRNPSKMPSKTEAKT